MLGGMAVSPSPQPLVLWQMLLAHENTHLQAHLASSPASLAPGWTPISLLLLQPDLCRSPALLCAHSPICVSTIPLGFICCLSSSGHLPVLQASSSPGPTSRPPCEPCSCCCWVPTQVGRRWEDGGREGGVWLVTPLRHRVPCCMVIGRWGWFSSLRDEKPDGWRELVI